MTPALHLYSISIKQDIHIRGGSRLLKWGGGGHSQTYHHVDVRLAGICTVVVCEAHGHVKYASTRGSGACPLRKF